MARTLRRCSIVTPLEYIPDTMSTLPIVSQIKSLWELCTGDVAGAKKVQQDFLDAWSHPVDQIGAMVDSIPVLGHVKGVVHLIKGDTDKFWESEEAATRTLVILGAGALTVSTGGAAAPILAGVVAGLVYDAATTGIESARHGKFDPQGYIDAGAEIKDDWRAGVFDLVAIGAMDGFLGKGKTGRATKVYRIEGESYWKNNNGEYTWNSNTRLFRDGDGIMVSRKPGGAGGFDAVEPIPLDEDSEYIQLDQTLPKHAADSLFLNTDDGARADAFYAKRVLQYQDAVAKMGRRPSHVTHNIKVKTFRIMTRDVERLQNRSISETGARTNIDNDGVLRVDPTKARGQYGCERRVYVPLLRRALKGSYKEFTPWIDHLPTPILRLIREHKIAYGCVRSIFIHTANPAFFAASLARDAPANLQPDPNQGYLVSDAAATLASHHIPLSYLSEEGIRSVHAQDIPVVGLRLARHAKCSRQNKTETYHGDHFEYLAEHADGTRHWYPSFLVADDLVDEFEGLSMANGKEVVEVVSSDSSTGDLTVSRLDGSTDTVKQADLFWAEEDPEDSVPLRDDELDTILHHGHYGRDHTSCHAVFSSSRTGQKSRSRRLGLPFPRILPCLTMFMIMLRSKQPPLLSPCLEETFAAELYHSSSSTKEYRLT
ncbi:hypothetical protein GALMADRAFT_900591 [Galerina marginata CBS 339.88]|uniref:Uncharacterized protein n=1 Tax=Galerina marginata (strain CBS 339.88) TaxID=685588 RepID=A0A067SJ35_GALM3|nr:hypothetical protein GALMADRAFT_900591 [Galerina marginata CBS 339.88]